MTRRYVVVGAGGVGVAIAAGLSEAGIPVVLVSRGKTYEAIRAHGLHYAHAGWSRRLDVSVVDGADAVTLREDDVLVLTVKSQDAPAALADWAWRPVEGGGVGSDLPVLLTQNGLDAERVALRYFSKVVAGVTLVAARHVIAGKVEVGNAPRIGQLIVGAYPSAALAPGAGEAAAGIAADLQAANWLSQDVPDVARWLAWKVLVNVTFSLALLEGSPAEVDELRTLLVDEARSVLTAAGYEFADPKTETTYDASEAAVSETYGKHQPSTWQSFVRGSGSEVDYLNGEVVLLARHHGLPAPVNDALQRLLGRSAALGEAPGTHRVGEVLALASTLTPTPEGAFA